MRLTWRSRGPATVVLIALLLTGACLVLGSQQAVRAVPAFSFSKIFVGSVSCSLDTGICAVTMVNTGTNSSYDLKVDGCHELVISFRSDFTTVYNMVSGPVGGFVVDHFPAGDTLVRFPFGTVATATCSLSASQLQNTRFGDPASGYFTMEAINPIGNIPPGTNASVVFGGIWTVSARPVTVTSVLSSVSTSSISSTSTATVTLSTATDSGALPNFDLVLDATVAILLVVVSVLMLKRR